MDAAGLIREARHRSGLTQRLLAVRAATSHSTLAAYESGAKTPNASTLVRVLRAAGFDLRVELESVGPFEDRGGQGRRLEAVLELAESFPVGHHRTIRYPRLPAAAS